MGCQLRSRHTPYSDLPTPLHWALRYNPDTEVASLLLEGGANISASYYVEILSWSEEGQRTGSLMTPLHLAAAFNPNPEVADALLKWGAEFTTGLFRGTELVEDAYYYERIPSLFPSLHWALRYNSNLAVAELLMERGATLDFTDYRGTLLHYAVAYGNSEITEALLDQGADAKDTDSDGKTPCQLAREKGRFTGTPILGRLCRP